MVGTGFVVVVHDSKLICCSTIYQIKAEYHSYLMISNMIWLTKIYNINMVVEAKISIFLTYIF